MTDIKDRNIVGIHHDRVSNVYFPGHYPGVDDSWDIEKFKKEVGLDIHYLADYSGNFDLTGIDTSVANAFRRIMIAEVPSVAIEYVTFMNNTSVIQDEVLAHRIGLIPLKVDPDRLEWFRRDAPAQVDPATGEEVPASNESNTLTFHLHVECSRNPKAAKDETDPNKLYINSMVYARDLKYVGSATQLEQLGGEAPAALHPDIVIAKLRPGQEIDLYAHAILGVGSDHAKFSPVATASYRLMPKIDILEPITGADAVKFQKCFSEGVIGIDKDGAAFVADPRRDTVSREVLRHEEFKGKVKLGRVRDHFIYNIESTGAMQPDEIFVKSIGILRNKALDLLAYDLSTPQ
ncbi:hypothetical protein D0Z03_001444 [Geotrichum reessii]|nr:hypothetical protein D0Z03_001444 [Galactomyces reessii]